MRKIYEASALTPTPVPKEAVCGHLVCNERTPFVNGHLPVGWQRDDGRGRPRCPKHWTEGSASLGEIAFRRRA